MQTDLIIEICAVIVIDYEKEAPNANAVTQQHKVRDPAELQRKARRL